MCSLFPEPESTVTAEDIREQVEIACRRMMAMAEAVIALSFKGAVASDFGGGRYSGDAPRNSAELAVDDLRSMATEALTGFALGRHHVDSTDLASAWRERLARNAVARRAPAVASPDTTLMEHARARGAAVRGFL